MQVPNTVGVLKERSRTYRRIYLHRPLPERRKIKREEVSGARVNIDESTMSFFQFSFHAYGLVADNSPHSQ